MGQSKKRKAQRKEAAKAHSAETYKKWDDSNYWADNLARQYENELKTQLWIKKRAKAHRVSLARKRRKYEEVDDLKDFVEQDDGKSYPLASFLIQLHFYRPPRPDCGIIHIVETVK